MLARLEAYWGELGCVRMHPYHTELAAGTMNPATFLRCLGPTPWRTAYAEPVIRPTDGRYGENPFRFQHYIQYQVILKPAPEDALDLYFGSLDAIGIDLRQHDLRLVEDDWEQPTLGAWGLGWEVWCDGMEITQWTYFQQLGGLDVEVVPAEITYGTERLAMFIQGKRTAFDIEGAPVDVLTRRFDEHEAEARDLVERGLPLPAYDQVLKCSHVFNLLDARGAVSVSERARYIARVRDLARAVAHRYVEADALAAA